MMLSRAGRPFVAALIFALSATSVFAQASPGAITRIEEDWRIEVGTPSPDENAPQISIITCPGNDLSEMYSLLDVNVLSLPDFYGGGLQFQTWVGDVNTSACHHTNIASLATEGEVVTFTVSMRVSSSGMLRFRILNGVSQTWGNFDSQTLRLDQPTTLVDLSGYSPDNSAKYSRVSYASNRIRRLVMTEVRYYVGTTLIATDTQDRVVQDLQEAP